METAKATLVIQSSLSGHVNINFPVDNFWQVVKKKITNLTIILAARAEQHQSGIENWRRHKYSGIFALSHFFFYPSPTLCMTVSHFLFIQPSFHVTSFANLFIHQTLTSSSASVDLLDDESIAGSDLDFEVSLLNYFV